MFGQRSNNRGVEWLGVPTFLRNDRSPWDDNILCPSPRWGVRGTCVIWSLYSQHVGHYGSLDVPWRGALPSCVAYLTHSPENLCTTARRVSESTLGAPSGAHPKYFGFL